MEDELSHPDSVTISNLKNEWLDIEKELLSRFNALTEYLLRADQEQADPTQAAQLMHAEIDVCLDRLNRIKVELADLRRAP
jgi:hypothetical protein